MRTPLAALAAALLLAACAAPPAPPPGASPLPTVGAPGENVPGADAHARALLSGLQVRSFREHREYCGYLIRTGDGGIRETPPNPGTLDGCELGLPPPNAFASYHTHGAWDAGYDNEVPSLADLEGDFRFRHDGYVSTPGGRFWRIEYDQRAALLLCGRGCLPADPRFVVEAYDEATIRGTLTLGDIRARAYGPGPAGFGAAPSPTGRIVR